MQIYKLKWINLSKLLAFCERRPIFSYAQRQSIRQPVCLGLECRLHFRSTGVPEASQLRQDFKFGAPNSRLDSELFLQSCQISASL